VQGNNFSLSLTVYSKEETDRLFNGLSAGGTVTMPLADTFWGDYFGMFTDKFGINWMISFATEQAA
jgi:PhnB protein